MSIQTTIQRFHPSGKFFLLLGLFLLCLGIASVIQVLIILPYADLQSMKDLAKLEDFSNPNIVKGMKIAQAVSVLFAFIIPSFLFAFYSSEKKISYLKINKGFSAVIGIVVILLVFAVMPVINWTGELNSHLTLPGFMSGLENWMKTSEESLKKLTDAFLQMNGIGDLIVNIIVVALLAAVGEELLFRGCMQNVFFEWTKNKHAAIWITAILFSALHAQFYGFLPRMLLGVVLGYLYIWSGSLWLSMLFHFLNNGMAVVFAYLVGKGSISETAETIGSNGSPIYFVYVSAVISAGLMFFVYKKSPTPTLPVREGE
ncbi:MAG: CPBP family intramembrane metalloprotease [Bacteroidetes bacterium]|nr:CPBP family intramembrane metalloprotease [Bacteroidota bacterium]